MQFTIGILLLGFLLFGVSVGFYFNSNRQGLGIGGIGFIILLYPLYRFHVESWNLGFLPKDPALIALQTFSIATVMSAFLVLFVAVLMFSTCRRNKPTDSNTDTGSDGPWVLDRNMR